MHEVRKSSKEKTEQDFFFLKLNSIDMTINRDKCQFDCERISYLGYEISEDVMSPDDQLINKILVIAAHRNKK